MSRKSLSPVAPGRSSKPISSSPPPADVPERTCSACAGLSVDSEWKMVAPLSRPRVARVEDRRNAEIDVGRRPRTWRHERQVVRQRAELAEAVVDQEEGDAFAGSRRAEIDGAGTRRHVHRVVEQDVDVADRAVGGDLVVCRACWRRPTRRTSAPPREPTAPSPVRNGFVGEAVDPRQSTWRAFL